ncbi:MAG: VOC family protein [Stackebrandtia sp.]
MNDDFYSTVTPYLRYPDGDAAAEWLTRVFGFGPTQAARDEQDKWYEGHIAVGGASVAIGGGASRPSGGYLIIGVRSADEMYQRIRSAGVAVDEPQDKPYGPRTVSVTDPWGTTWDFWQGEAKI